VSRKEAVFASNALLNFRLDVQRWTLLRLEAIGARRKGAAKVPAHLVTGERGEFEAMFYLRRLGYLFVERRWRSPELRGDLDLIGWDGDTLCFIEVKARTARDFAPAEAGVDDQKKTMLRRMARAYRRTLPREVRAELKVRFDVVSVYLLGQAVDCELVRNAFAFVADEELPASF
jgi:putative endonuclease